MKQIMQTWRNAVEIRSNERKKAQWKDATRVISAIQREWDRRRRYPPRDDDFFVWPDTDAPVGNGKISTEGWLEEGLLRFMGYQVGSINGVATPYRRRILEEIFEGVLPPVFDAAYLAKWGPPGSALRLQQMAETLAAFVRNNKRKKNPNYVAAIRSWESDLRFLYEQYYVDRFHFGWPTADL